MKNMMRNVLLLALAVGLGSCGLLDIEIESTFSGVLDVDVEEPMTKGTDDVYPFESFTTIDPADDDDVQEYIDKIVEVSVDGVVAEVVSVTEEGAVFLSGTTFSITDGVDDATWPLTEDWPIVVGTTVMLEDLGGAYDDAAAILLKMEEFTIGMVGNSSVPGVNVTVKIDIETTITGNPLE